LFSESPPSLLLEMLRAWRSAFLFFHHALERSCLRYVPHPDRFRTRTSPGWFLLGSRPFGTSGLPFPFLFFFCGDFFFFLSFSRPWKKKDNPPPSLPANPIRYYKSIAKKNSVGFFGLETPLVEPPAFPSLIPLYDAKLTILTHHTDSHSDRIQRYSWSRLFSAFSSMVFKKRGNNHLNEAPL